jgi:predicted neuraminidase
VGQPFLAAGRLSRRPRLWLACALLIAPAAAALQIGETAGPIDLLSPGGWTVTLTDYGARRATAVLFLSARDAADDAVAGTIRTLNQTNRRRRVLLVGIFSDPEQKAAEVRAYCQSHGFNFPVYLDPQMTAAKRFGAQVTPTAYLLDNTGRLIYKGSVQELSAAIIAHDSGSTPRSEEGEINGTPIGKHRPPREIVSPYGAIEFSSELIFDSIPGYPVHHCSTITEAANGDLLASWYGGSYESSDDQVLFLSRRKKGARTWSKPEILVQSPGHPPGNAVLFTDKRNRIWLVWGRMEGAQPMLRGTGWDACRLFYRTSSDNGITWTKDQPFYQDTLGWLPRNLTITLADGRLIVPISDERNGHGVDWSFFLATKDDGATWTQSGIMKGGEQPTFIERSDGTLLCYMRTRPNIKASESHDGGKTWSEPVPTQWKNPDAGISMRRLANGHVILVFNNQDNARTPLHIALSTDEARTWLDPLILETNPGEYSYPSVLQTSDGKIHIIYTFRRYSIKHVEMNEDWLVRMTRPN